MPTRANLAAALVATPPSPASSGTTLTVAVGKGARFPTPPFNATVGPATAAAVPFAEQAEIVRVTKVTGDELTIVRAFEGPNAARSVVAGDMIAQTDTIDEFGSTSIVAPLPSGGDDSKAVQECYEAMGKPGILQLQAGTYKFDTGVKFRKYACWLRGHGASSMEIESKIVTAGTLITCNSKNGTAIETSQSGTIFSDFALQNNTNVELATLSEELKSSGAAITELPVNALAEAIPNSTRLIVKSGAGPFELGTLSVALTTVSTITSMKVNALASTIPNGTKITLTSGANTQVFTLSAEALAGATELKVESLKPNFAYPIGTKITGGNFVQFWTMTSEAAKAATKIKVTSQKPNFSYAATTTQVEGGPFEGSVGINVTRFNAAGEEKTEGNSRGRYFNLDIEGFFVNYKQIAGFECRFADCTFTGAVKYQFQYGDPANTDAGGLFINNCTFIATKNRKCNAYLRWESGGGVFVENNSFVYDPESIASVPEYCVDFSFLPTGKKGTSNLTYANNHTEGFEKAGVRFFASKEATGLANIACTGNEIRAFNGTAGRVCVLAEGESGGVVKSVTISNNRLDSELATEIKLNNVTEFNCVGNTILSPGLATVYITLEGTSSAAGTGYPTPASLPTNITFGKAEKGFSSGAQNTWVTLLATLTGGEELHWEVKFGAGVLISPKYIAPPGPIYGTLNAELTAASKITAMTVKPLFTAIPNATTFTMQSPKGASNNQEFVTSAEAKAGATEIKVVEKEVSSALAVGTAVAYGAGAEGYTFSLPTIMLQAGQTFEVIRLDAGEIGASYVPKAIKQSAP